jgi:hypothetical protein
MAEEQMIALSLGRTEWSGGQMESGDPSVEPIKKLSDLKRGDIVVLTSDSYSFRDPPQEKLVRVTFVYAKALSVGYRRFSIASGKEMEESDSGGWRVIERGSNIISIPTQEQLERLPDPDGNYTEAQILKRREKTVEGLVREMREHLDPGSPEFDQRKEALYYFLSGESTKEILVEVWTGRISSLETENKDLKSRLKQLEKILNQALSLVRVHNLQVEHGVLNSFTDPPDEDQ